MMDRRSLLAGLAIAPVAIAAPVIAASNPYLPAWESAKLAERKARASMDEFYALHMQPANLAYTAGTIPLSKVLEVEEAWSEFTSAHAKAIDAVIATAAPHLDAVRTKLEFGLDDGAFNGDAGEQLLRTILADLRRLSA